MKAKAILLMSLTLLVACSEEHEDLQTWMAQTRNEAKSKIRPPEPLPPAVPVEYVIPAENGINSFDMKRIIKQKQGGTAPAPQKNRPTQELELVDLNELQFVGTLGTGKNLGALIKYVGNGGEQVYTVKVGNYMGKNYGRITKITMDQLTLVETYAHPEGGYFNKVRVCSLEAFKEGQESCPELESKN